MGSLHPPWTHVPVHDHSHSHLHCTYSGMHVIMTICQAVDKVEDRSQYCLTHSTLHVCNHAKNRSCLMTGGQAVNILLYGKGRSQFTLAPYYLTPSTLRICKHAWHWSVTSLQDVGWWRVRRLRLSAHHIFLCYMYVYVLVVKHSRVRTFCRN